MLHFKTFRFDEKISTEKAINDFFKEHRKVLSPQGIHIFEDRICFIYDDASDEEVDRIKAISNLKITLTGAKTDLIIRRQELFFAERDAASGRGKPGQVVDRKHDVATCEARIDYLKEQIKGLEKE